jgi:hypothetical protein
LKKVLTEQAHTDGENEVTLSRSGGVLAANLQLGADLSSAVILKANALLAAEGVKPHGMGFVLTDEEKIRLLSSNPDSAIFIKPYKNGRDIAQTDRNAFIIDLHGMTSEDVLHKAPALYQYVYNTVRPERLTNNEPYRRENWWLFGRKNTDLRAGTAELQRYIVTVKTAKHRVFLFLNGIALPDSKLIAISSDDTFHLGVLSSIIHCIWTLRIGSHLGVGNDPTYVVGSSFNKFPFPALEESPLKQPIRELGERLDAHRKRQQAQHPDLTLTGIYNVLEKLRAGETLTPKDRNTHDQGLISVLKQIHDDLDAAVLEAYGWPGIATATPPADLLAQGGPTAEALEQQILTRLLALNHERAAEEKSGLIRYLRPDYQSPGTATAHQTEIGLSGGSTTPDPTAATILDWPTDLPTQVAALRKLLLTHGQDPETLAACFGRKNKKRTDQITAILATLKALGHIV